MLGILLSVLIPPAAAAEAAKAPVLQVALLGGPAFTSGSLSAFTQQTQSSPKAQVSRGYGTGANIGLRGAVWAPGRAWGLGVDGSYLDLPVEGGGMRAVIATPMLMLRPPKLAESRLFPYIGIGPSVYFLKATADYTPQVAVPLKTTDGMDKLDWTFEACAGLQARLAERLVLLAEARFSYLTVDEDYTPSAWFSPPSRYRQGLATEALPVALRLGLGVEF